MENKRRLIDADLMALEESEAYMKVQTSGSVSPVTYEINSVVHRKIQKLIASAPAVDAVEVVHGRWEEQYIPNGKYVAWDGFYCSICGKQSAKSNYCPNCGAKMDGDKNA